MRPKYERFRDWVAAVHESVVGTKRQFAIAPQLVRFWGEADINWQRESAALVANDP
jgi:hypothetical protein